MIMKAEKAKLTEWLKDILLIIGVVLAVLGFFSDHWNQIQRIVSNIAPRYTRAMAAYERMLSTGSEIGPADVGFTEVASICSEKLSGSGDLTIASIRVTQGVSLLFKGTPIAEDFVLEITLQDGRSATGNIADLRPQIRERYLEGILFRWSLLFFLLGVAIILLERFVIDRFLPSEA